MRAQERVDLENLPQQRRPAAHPARSVGVLATDGAGGVQVYDAAGKVRAHVALRSALPSLSPGRHTVTLDARFAGDVPTTLELRLRGAGAPEVVRALRR